MQSILSFFLLSTSNSYWKTGMSSSVLIVKNKVFSPFWIFYDFFEIDIDGVPKKINQRTLTDTNSPWDLCWRCWNELLVKKCQLLRKKNIRPKSDLCKNVNNYFLSHLGVVLLYRPPCLWGTVITSYFKCKLIMFQVCLAKQCCMYILFYVNYNSNNVLTFQLN